MSGKDHWERVYTEKASDALSWFQHEATLSLRLLENAGLSPST